MNTILVTSDFTYTPNNYNDVLETVLNKSQKKIRAVILIRINLLNIFYLIPYLYLSGCKNIANTLINNIIDILLKRKEKLFKKYNIPFKYVKNINGHETILWIKQIKPNLIINMRARYIFRETILSIPNFGCVNVHHGLLPKQKGLFCNLYALANNQETGFTIHKMNNKIDQGQIYYREKVKGNKNYLAYLANNAVSEGVAIANFINNLSKNNSLMKGISNKCDNPITTTTPNFSTIKQLQKKGIIL